MLRFALQILFVSIGFLVASCSSTVTSDPEAVDGNVDDTAAAVIAKTMADMEVKEQWSEAGRFSSGDMLIIAISMEAAASNPAAYQTLDEAMKMSQVTVSETPGGDVNTLLVTNRGTKPVFLMIGDLLLGGDQDRVVAESLLVDAGAADVSVPVYCVEQGRWGTNEADGELSAKREFRNVSKAGQVSLGVKSAALATKSQGGVWQAVAETNQTAETHHGNSTGTFRAVVNDKKVSESVEAELSKARDALSKDACGYVVMSRGEVVSLDLFDSAELCQKLSEKLLRGYLVSATTGELQVRDGTNQTRAGSDQQDGLQQRESSNVQTLTSTVQTAAPMSRTFARASNNAPSGDNAPVNQNSETVTNPTTSTSNTRIERGSTVILETRAASTRRLVHRCLVRK